ncbi:MAG: plastocyanin/azurin family copper-binding protein [Chloroflexota bacterium]
MCAPQEIDTMHLKYALLAVLTAAIVANCGGSNSGAGPGYQNGPTKPPASAPSSSAPTAAPATAAPATEVPPTASPGPSASPDGAISPAEVGIADYEFLETAISVTVGTTVRWTNTGLRAHTVTGDDGGFDSGVLAPGATFDRLFPSAGTFMYHCTIHSGMTAEVTVTQ